MFSIPVPRVATPTQQRQQRAVAAVDSLAELGVLCVDNDPEILDGMRALLGRWQVEEICASTVDDALAQAAHAP